MNPAPLSTHANLASSVTPAFSMQVVNMSVNNRFQASLISASTNQPPSARVGAMAVRQGNTVSGLLVGELTACNI